MPTNTPYKIALMWHGDRAARDTAKLADNRLAKTAQALAAVGIATEPAVYNDDFADEVREQLLKLDGVLVWVNPIEQGRGRAVLDALLREVAAAGVLVSTHPDMIQKIGTKEVLVRTRGLGWGCDTHPYADARAMRSQFPQRLAQGKPRVLKQNRGHSGNGVWKVDAVNGGATGDAMRVRVREARRDSPEEVLPLEAFLARCDAYFTDGGRIIDQAWQERLAEGMVRCYLVRDRVEGFGEQLVNMLHPDAPAPGPRLYYPPTRPDFQPLKVKVEQEFLPAMQALLGIATGALPLLWDADFLYGPKTASGEDTYVLCEINVSSVYPYPESALEPLAQATLAALRARA
jgi:hypothetical protein